MRVLCGLSGIEYKCDFFPAYLTSREVCHPIFYLDQHKLLSFYPKWLGGELNDVDSYLLYLALLNSTELVEWRVPAQKTEKTVAVVAHNLHSLVQIVSKINVIRHPNFALPRFAITPETKHLDNSYFWIQAWNDAYNEWSDGYKTRSFDEKIKRREEALERLINNSARTVESYAHILADWAAMAGEFPTFDTTVAGKTLPISDYWRHIIKLCAKSESIISIPKKDLEELIEHCEDKIPHGSIYAHTLMEYLRTSLAKHNSFLGLGDIDLIGPVTYRILSPETSVEDANKQVMIDSAPLTKPERSMYPSTLAYLKAKARYDMAQAYSASNKGETNVSNSGL